MHVKTLEYCNKLNQLELKRNFVLIENVVALVYTHFAFFHQGYELLKELEPAVRDMTSKTKKK